MNPRQKALDDLNKQQGLFLGSSNPILGQRAQKTEPRKTSNRLYGSYNPSAFSGIMPNTLDCVEILNNFCNKAKYSKNPEEIFVCLHNVAVNFLNLNFVSIGFLSNSSNIIKLKLFDRINNSFSLKISTADIKNPLVEAMQTKQIKFTQNIDFLHINHLNNMQTIILPLISKGQNIGVLAAGGDDLTTQKVDILKLLSEFATIYMQNLKMDEVVSQKIDEDTLTGLKNHRSFQDELHKQLEMARSASQSLSVMIFDINDIAKINREKGHARGDEVIKYISKKIEENIRKADVAARYGGDEIAVILPDTDSEEAFYLAEYLNYTTTCNSIFDEKLTLSIGIANYPNCSTSQEKLLLLAEQAMVISKHNNYKDNTASNIVSASDINFWDGTSLKSFASVISKRHAELGINFEEEIVNQFHTETIKSDSQLVEIATSLSGAIDAKDTYTRGHSQFVSHYSEKLAIALELSKKEVQQIKLGALLHDVGKIGIPESILRKNDNLTEEEWNIMKQHPSIGVKKVLQPIEILNELIPIVEHHHEKWDGTGYPKGLKGDSIPLGARIVAIADAYHALISDRPYRKGLGVETAIKVLKTGAGIQWQAELVQKFIEIIPKL